MNGNGRAGGAANPAGTIASATASHRGGVPAQIRTGRQGADLSERQAYRWVSGQLHSLPHPSAQAVLEEMFGEPVARLFAPPYSTGAVRPSRRCSRIEATNVGAETLDQFFDDRRRLVVTYQQQLLPTLLGDHLLSRESYRGRKRLHTVLMVDSPEVLARMDVHSAEVTAPAPTWLGAEVRRPVRFRPRHFY